jgi:hypothetical protein
MSPLTRTSCPIKTRSSCWNYGVLGAVGRYVRRISYATAEAGIEVAWLTGSRHELAVGAAIRR